MATEAAGVPRGSVDPDRLGVIFGSEVFYCEVEELAETYRGCLVDGKFDFSRWGEAMNRIYPLSMLKYLPNMPACQIGIAHDARGPNNSITLGDVSGLLAVIEAASVIRRGLADVMIAGGTGSRINLVRMVNYGDGDLSHRGDNPAGACRPFDAARDGVVNGEGAAAFVLESARHAQRRGATVLATIAGYASGFQSKADGKPGGAIGRSITTALEAAELSPAMVGHVNADGRSTVTEDEIEARAIAATLGDVPVFAPKSYFGHLGSGTGAVELLTSVLAIQSGEIPPTLNYETPDPRCPVQVTCGRPQEARQSTAVVLNQARTGQAVAVVITGP
jgi:3-oxoacyl-[acyl-carrier-protein] synthase II